MVANKGGSWLVSSNSKIINKVKKNGFVGGLNTLFGSQVMIPKKCFIFCLKFTYIYRCSVRDSDHKAFISSLVVGSTREQATARPERARKRLESRSALASFPFSRSLCRYFQIQSSEIPGICPDGLNIDLHCLIQRYPTAQVDRSRVIIFVLIAHLLIRHPSIDALHIVPVTTLEVCEAILEGRNPASVILADLFTGLDSGVSAMSMRGSPLLLQI
jgi:hypothetical protein